MGFSIWPWDRTEYADIVYKSGRLYSLETWGFEAFRNQDTNQLTAFSAAKASGTGFTYIRLDEVASIFYRRGHIRWRGFRR